MLLKLGDIKFSTENTKIKNKTDKLLASTPGFVTSPVCENSIENRYSRLLEKILKIHKYRKTFNFNVILFLPRDVKFYK